MTHVPAEQVHDALNHLYDPALLETHPLAAALGGGRALRRAIEDAIDALAPPRDGRGGPKARRRHDLLRLRYLDGLAVEAVQARLAVGRSEYYREHGRAVAALAALLGPRVALPPSPPVAPPRPAAGAELTRPIDSFVGRQREVEEVLALLARGRLVTIVGPPGAGKTRLALEVAGRRAAGGGRAEIRLVGLAPVVDPGLVVPTVARSLGVVPRPGEAALDALVDGIGERVLLLVLDNFEQVAAAGPDLVALLAGCPGVRVLATSRVALRVPGEQRYPLAPLPAPATSDTTPSPPDALMGWDAVRLFVERAGAVQPGFGVSAENALAVAELCRRLDGLPLALELAAARVNVLGPAALLARLDRRLQVLSGAGGRTLRGALETSYELLGPALQAVYRRLGVFRGGWTLEAAAAVAGASLDDLSALVDSSLVRVAGGAGGEPRFAMLETIREHALERLAADPGESEARRRHLAYVAERADAAALGYLGPDNEGWLGWFEAERDNLRAAFDHCLGAPAEDHDAYPDLGRRTAAGLWRYWIARDPPEGRVWLERLLAEPGGSAGGRAFAMAAAAWLAHVDGAPAEAERLLDDALALARSAGERRAVALALEGIAMLRGDRNERVAAVELHREAIALHREMGDEPSACASTVYLCDQLASDMRFDEARSVGEAGLALARRLESTDLVQWFLVNLARIELCTGNRDAARALLDERLAVPTGHETWQWAFALLEHARLLCADDPAAAPAAVAMALEAFRRLRAVLYVQDAVELAAALVAVDDPARAARLYGSAEAWRERAGVLIPPLQRPDYERDVASLRAALAPAALAAAWAEGRTLSADRSVDEALAALGALARGRAPRSDGGRAADEPAPVMVGAARLRPGRAATGRTRSAARRRRGPGSAPGRRRA